MSAARPAGDFDYDAMGGGYAVHRQPDPRIAAQILAALGDARTVLNVGAGAGSYEPTDRQVVAVEPSSAMRAQRPRSAAPTVRATAEALPFDDKAFDAAMAISTVHQWPDLARGLGELRRVARGPVVVLSFAPNALAGLWLKHYAPTLIASECDRSPPIETIAANLGGRTRVEIVPIPNDCTDGFVEAFYARPERLLDPAVRAAQSCWSFVDPAVVARDMAALTKALESGAWDARHGHWRTLPAYDGSVRLVISER